MTQPERDQAERGGAGEDPDRRTDREPPGGAERTGGDPDAPAGDAPAAPDKGRGSPEPPD